MEFRKYDHVERLGNDEVEGLTVGDVHVFPKLDGTNASVWFDINDMLMLELYCASRTRVISKEADNAGFWVWAHDPNNINKLFEVANSCGSNWIIYGEWLVPHTLKTYREEAWRKFYVFDVYDRKQHRYISYDEYEPTIKGAGLDVIEPMCVITNPSIEQLHRESENNSYLILDGAGCGEGIVLKNYLWTNQWGRQPWAKIVRNEFKEENRRAFGTTIKGGEYQVEAAIAEEYVTVSLVEKTRSKILQSLIDQDVSDGIEVLPETNSSEFYEIQSKRVQERHRGQFIPRLLGTVYHELVSENIWEAVKTYKDPTIDFKKLKAHCIFYTKKYAADLF